MTRDISNPALDVPTQNTSNPALNILPHNGSNPTLNVSLPNPYPIPGTRLSLIYDYPGVPLEQQTVRLCLDALKISIDYHLTHGASPSDPLPQSDPYSSIGVRVADVQVDIWTVELEPIVPMTYEYALQVLEGMRTVLDTGGYFELFMDVLLEGAEHSIGNAAVDAWPPVLHMKA